MFTSSSSLGIALLKRRVRRLYLDFGVEIFCTIDAFDIGTGVFTIDGSKRFVGVDEPNATTVFLTCITRLTLFEFVEAKIDFQ